MHVTAFAPATVANVAVGFDLLGFAVDVLGDRVTLTKGEPGVRVVIQGLEDSSAIPTDPAKNTATVGLLALIEDLEFDFGFDVHVDKGIPLGSGLGGSAASAVASIVAANDLLGSPLTQAKMLHYALMGEAVASGSAHPDNAAPCLYGGFTLAHGLLNPMVERLPLMGDLRCILVHPHIRLDTREARAVLPEKISLATAVHQNAYLAGFLTGLFTGNEARMMESMRDVLVEPHRKHLIPGYDAARKAALEAGAGAFSISGGGPTVFAFAHAEDAPGVLRGIRKAFADEGAETDGWMTHPGSPGASIVERGAGR